MTRQLELIDGMQEWELDDSTRDSGRRGVERARAALIAARRRMSSIDEPQHASGTTEAA